jgi:glycosyltransferase involved in cell wall biosynthesis
VFCTTIIPTLGRDTLDRAVESALSETLDEPLNIIVVNDTGRPLAAVAWQPATRVRVIHTQRRVARKVGAALARGKYLHFLDDDDWLLPRALAVFWDLAQECSTAWLYGAAQLTDIAGHCLFRHDHQLSGNCLTQVLAGEWVPLQASLIATTAFFSVGGFDNRLAGPEDQDLLLRIARWYELAGTPKPVAGILRGIWDTSTDYGASRKQFKASREVVLSEPGTLARLRAAANNSYWQGRWLRAYLLLAWWNLRRRKGFASLSPLIGASTALMVAGPHTLSPDYWRGLTRPHHNDGFVPATQPAARALDPNRLTEVG